jgi:zinc protease
MKKISVLACLLFAFTVALQAQPKLIEKISKQGNEVVIPYEKYVLPNGLTVVIHEDHSDPAVYVDVTYHVGSAREEIGRSGFAHFFEHMMFQGSDHVGDDQHFKIVSEAGGNLNGTTNSDRTNYFETMPSNQLEIALWLEADRMGFLLDAVTQKKFEIQRSTVKNERGQNYDNRPYGLVNEKTYQAMYPYGHPYSWSTIGYLVDLDRVDVNDLKQFFLRWYGPNNATLTVAGDVKPAEVLKLAEKYFGTIPQCPAVKNQVPVDVKLDKDRYISYEDNIKFPMLQMAYPTVPARHPDEAPLDILAEVLGQSKNSTIYQNLVKSQKSVQALAEHGCRELSGSFEIGAIASPGNSLESMEKELRKSMDEFEKKGVSDEDLKRFKASYEANTINSLNSVRGKGAQLAYYQTFTGNPNYIKTDMSRYLNVTKEDVMRVYKKYIKNMPAVILSVYPKGKPEMKAHEDNFTPPVINPNDADHAEYKGLTYKKATDTFDRSKKPAAGDNPVVKVPEPWKENFENGLKVIGSKNDEIPSVTLQLTIEAGHRLEEKSKAGIAQLLGDMMQESTQNYTSEQMEDALAKLGSSISVAAGANEITVTVSSLSKNLDATLKLAEEILFRPKFDKEDFDLVKTQKLQAIANQVTQPVVVANNIFNKLLYGDNSIMSIPAGGTTATVTSITLEDVKAYYEKNFSPNISSLVIVGDVSKEAILKNTEFLKKWKSKNVQLPKEDPAVSIDKTKIYLINKDKAAQSEIRMGYMSMPYDATGDYYKSTLMNFTLGGAFNSRINMNLREDKGFTYGARSSFNGSKYAGPFVAAAGVRADATDSSAVEFIKELSTYANSGISDEELAFTKSSIGLSEALKYETPAQKASFLKRISDYNLGTDFVDKQNAILQTITKEEINKLAKEKVGIDKMIITVVGDKKLIYDGLSKLGYEIIEMDADGKVLYDKNNQPLYPTDKK